MRDSAAEVCARRWCDVCGARPRAIRHAQRVAAALSLQAMCIPARMRAIQAPLLVEACGKAALLTTVPAGRGAHPPRPALTCTHPFVPPGSFRHKAAAAAMAKALPALASIANAALRTAPGGEEVRAATLWAQSPVLIFALRRPGCVLCRDTAKKVRAGDLEKTTAASSPAAVAALCLRHTPTPGSNLHHFPLRSPGLGRARAVCGGGHQARVRGA